MLLVIEQVGVDGTWWKENVTEQALEAVPSGLHAVLKAD